MAMPSNISFLQKLLSYLYELELEKTSSEINPSLEVYLTEGRTKLLSKNATYSYSDRYTVFREAFHQIAEDLHKVENALILGYGLGSIPYILKKAYNLLPKYTAVDIDPKVIELARKYGFTQNVRFLTVDAMDFVEQDGGLYDLICVDIFIDREVPEKFTGPEFLYKLDGLLEDGGLLFFNRLAMTPALKKEAENYFDGIFNKIFPGGKMLKTPYNLVMYYKK